MSHSNPAPRCADSKSAVGQVQLGGGELGQRANRSELNELVDSLTSKRCGSGLVVALQLKSSAAQCCADTTDIGPARPKNDLDLTLARLEVSDTAHPLIMRSSRLRNQRKRPDSFR